MTNLYNPNSTICAIATPAGGAIGIVRVSGPEALTCVSPLFQPMGSKTLAEKAGGTLTFGRIVDPTSHETVDEVLVSLFRRLTPIRAKTASKYPATARPTF